jgi:hypothetical protein
MFGKCNCNPVFIFVYVILGAGALWLLAAAFTAQLNGAEVMSVFPWWFAAVLVAYLAKMTKIQSACDCSMHGNHCHTCMPEEKKM